ncbi:MAG: DinB family protein [Fimbriimonadia bacterium]|jgi:uncharacterized damage-inducible protein DinB
MDRALLVMQFDQILEGWDIPTPAGVLRVREDSRAAVPAGAAYSILTNLAHTVLWQDFWLQKLAGGRRKAGPPEWNNDFRVPDPSEWHALKKRLLDGLQEARRIAASEPFDHKLVSDQEAVETLIRILIHVSYHLGQMNLLRRMASSAKRA